MIDKCEKLCIKKQAELLSLNRTSLYYKPIPTSQEELEIKQIIDKIYTKHPDYGYRRMTTILNRIIMLELIKKEHAGICVK